ncbi:ShlB/FhaC/HecB family hemolysin secretion/activation protein [Aquibaculum arenosum]|uniref:ShlB/FhaC/HecB family hemolysin secretion/activation protein n=1 Tax=Aquibaculum arenosum TaxID=3032591 RepID=A0ABT5YR60_9PROT|nr:ShlB/FhaC/HecB family hemolysin secretion/activation protein [Fodinicurvata sp. CAU 1616]MDF2097468.1 ShlB/FhaC/HecB family hemolysin secretion/activation protein [Fodinicurvata sp. CAU 1616]
MTASSQAAAQSAIERNVPPAPERGPATIIIDEQDFGRGSSEPLGVDLSGVTLIGQDEAVQSAPPSGVSGTPEGADPQAMEAALAPFIGQPLSLDLAAEVQAAIAGVYRAAGRPFVSVTLPPQEVTQGILQVRIIEFRLGEARVSGVDEDQAASIRADLRLEPGQPIDARALEEDLSWINRSPFLDVEGTFRPGTETALTELDVPVTRSRPLSVSGGWTNTGSEATGLDRYFLGLDLSLQPLNGAWLSYQVTGSDDLWRNRSKLLPSKGKYPNYLSHAGRIVVPTWPRQALEISPNYVVSREDPNQFITFESTTLELPIIYRSAISNLLPQRYWGDIYGGVSFKRLERTTFFNGTEVADGSADVFQLQLGWSNLLTDETGRTAFDVSLHGNPGGVLSGNTDKTWSTFSNGRVDQVTYAYVNANVTRITRLPKRFAWLSTATGQVATAPLPDTERMPLGGFSAVRGYTFDDVTVDRALVWRNELRLPTFSPIGEVADIWDSLSPFLFADVGFGSDQWSDRDTTIAGLGAGLDYRIADNLDLNLAAGYALKDAGQTDAKDVTINAFIRARF